MAMRAVAKCGGILSRSFRDGRVLNEEECAAANMYIKSRAFSDGRVLKEEERTAEKRTAENRYIKCFAIGSNRKKQIYWLPTPRMPARYAEKNNWSPVQGAEKQIFRNQQMISLSNSSTDWECNWESLTDEEYEAFLLTLQKSTTGVTRSRFSSEEEYAACRKRHHRYVMSVAKELSAAFEGTDVGKDIKDLKGTMDFTNQISDNDVQLR